jgi:tetratricopeptide (TPR) repeat protein
MNEAQIAEIVQVVEDAEAALRGAGQADALAQLDAAMPAIRQALSAAVAQPDKTTALRLAGGLWRSWHIRGTLAEGQSWLEQALARSEDADPALRAKALDGAGVMTMDQGLLAESRAYHEQALALYQELGNLRLVAGNYESLSILASMRGDHAIAQAMLQQSFALRQQIGDDADVLVCALINMAVQAVRQADLLAAQTALDQATAYEARITQPSIWIGLQICRSVLAFERADYAQSAALSRVTLFQSLALGFANQVLLSLEGLAACAIETQRPAVAAHLYGAAEVWYTTTGIPVETLTRPDRPERIARGRQALGDAAWTVAWNDGMRMDQATLLAALGEEA